MTSNKKTVLITGSSRGIGKAIAEKFASENFNVVLNCKNSINALFELEKKLKKINSDILSIKCDVANYDNVCSMFNKIQHTFGGVDILVNNAGIPYIGIFNQMLPKEWNKIIDTNLKGVYNCTHIALPYMINQKRGNIINISSVWGNIGASCEVIYSSSKGAVNSFTKALAKELGPSGIRVNAAAFGAIETEMNSFLSEDEKKSLIDEIPFSRFGSPQEAAELIFFLASDSSNYISGQVITLDGAWI